MLRNISTPHLPEGKVRHIIIGKKYRNLLDNALFEHNLAPIWLENNPFVDERISGHADISAIHLSQNLLILSEYLVDCEDVNKVRVLGYNIEFTANHVSKRYPNDAKLNICKLGNKLIYNPRTADDGIISKLNGTIRIAVNQGYTKCSVCIVDNNSIITSDKLIAQKSEAAGVNTLLINESFVKLDGFDYGFIGGASFKINKNEIAFTGLIKDTLIKNRIEAFLKERNIKPVYLTDREIFDIGSAIPLTEEIV